MKKTTSIVLGVIVGIIVLLGMTYFTSYNSIISLEENVDAQYAKVDTQLQRRFDLIPNLVNATQGYMEHEKEVFTSLADARAKLAGARSVNDKVEASNEVEGAISRLLAITENYPELKANESFRALTDELAGTENRIATERSRYNDMVKDYNAGIRRFPKNIIANMMGAEKRDYFEAAAGSEQAPSVDFGNK
ncbi:MAG: LemA family protein [Turicibacter sp.]